MIVWKLTNMESQVATFYKVLQNHKVYSVFRKKFLPCLSTYIRKPKSSKQPEFRIQIRNPRLGIWYPGCQSFLPRVNNTPNRLAPRVQKAINPSLSSDDIDIYITDAETCLFNRVNLYITCMSSNMDFQKQQTLGIREHSGFKNKKLECKMTKSFYQILIMKIPYSITFPNFSVFYYVFQCSWIIVFHIPGFEFSIYSILNN